MTGDKDELQRHVGAVSLSNAVLGLLNLLWHVNPGDMYGCALIHVRLGSPANCISSGMM